MLATVLVGCGTSVAAGNHQAASTPSPTPSASPAGRGTTILRVLFDGTQHAFSDTLDNDTVFRGPKPPGYHIMVKSAPTLQYRTVNALTNIVGHEQQEDVDIDVMATREDTGPADAASYGVICRGTPSGSFYYFAVGSDGFIAIERSSSSDSPPTKLASGTLPQPPGAGTAHLVRGTCLGSELALYVDSTEKPVLKATDPAPLHGGGVGMELAGQAGTDVAFEKFEVRLPPGQ